MVITGKKAVLFHFPDIIIDVIHVIVLSFRQRVPPLLLLILLRRGIIQINMKRLNPGKISGYFEMFIDIHFHCRKSHKFPVAQFRIPAIFSVVCTGNNLISALLIFRLHFLICQMPVGLNGMTMKIRLIKMPRFRKQIKPATRFRMWIKRRPHKPRNLADRKRKTSCRPLHTRKAAQQSAVYSPPSWLS